MRNLLGTAFRDSRPTQSVGLESPANEPGTGSPLYHLNTWAMGWATDLELSLQEYPSDNEQSTDDDEGGSSSCAAAGGHSPWASAAADPEDEDSEHNDPEMEEAASDAEEDPVDTVDCIESDADDDTLAQLQSDPDDDEDWN